MRSDTDVGPMVSANQRSKVEAQVSAAVSAGAEVLVGGDPGGNERATSTPAVVTGADAETALLSEETFGPVAPLVPVKDLDEAIELANSTYTGSAPTSTPRTSRRSCAACARSRPARSGSTTRSPTTTRAVRRLQAVGPGTGARPRGPRGLPGDQARPHRVGDRRQGVGPVPEYSGAESPTGPNDPAWLIRP